MKKQTSRAMVTFVIVGWNNKDLLDECFISVTQQTYKNRSIIYVDNGSTDDSINYVKERYPTITVLDAGSNQGFAIGNNMGIAASFKNKDCRYVALLNSDARLASDWLEKLISFAESHPHGASFQSPTFDYYDRTVLDSIGIAINRRGQAVQLGYRQPKASLRTQKVFGVNAAAALYSRTFLEEQPFGEDYFDSAMWMYLEDVDLAARATVMGWENWSVNESEAYHMGSASSSKNPGFSVHLIYRNNLPLLVKNLPLPIVLKILPRLAAADCRILYGLVRGRNYVVAKALLRGRLRSLPMSFGFWAKHRQLQQRSVLNRSSLWDLLQP